MNYFELHIGDLTEATAHLSILEDGAYGRLMRKYYATEKPLPADVKQVQRLVGARSKEEREAVDTVLNEFFTLQDDGWHQSRCDAEIAAFHDKQVGKEGKRESAKERQRRARERRSSLFEQLRSHSIVPAWTTTTAELETLLSRVTGGDESQPVTLPVTRDDTATQTPDSRHQTPDTNVSKPPDGGSGSAQSADPPSPPPDFDGRNGEALNGKAVVPIAVAWELPEQWGLDAEALGWKPGEVLREAEKFRQYWTAGKGNGTRRSVKGWRQTWSNWLDKAARDHR